MIRKIFFIFVILFPLICWSYEKPIFHKNNNPKSPISKAVQYKDTYYLSGQLGLITDKKTGEQRLVDGGIKAQTKQAIKNIEDVLKSLGLTLKDAVKVTVIVKNMDDMQIFNKVYEKRFPQKPARMAFEVSSIAYDAAVEIEVTAIKAS